MDHSRCACFLFALLLLTFFGNKNIRGTNLYFMQNLTQIFKNEITFIGS